MSTPPQNEVPSEDFDQEEMGRRLVYSLLKPAVVFATRFRLGAKELGAFVQLAYLEALRREGKTLKEAAEWMGMSERNAKRLAKTTRTMFMKPETEYDLAVEIEFLLRASPMSRARLNQVLKHHSASEIDAAVDSLIADDVLSETLERTPVLQVQRAVTSKVRDTWISRVGALNSLLGNVRHVVTRRFIRQDPLAFARTMRFHMKREDAEELQTLYAKIIEVLERVDTDAGEDAVAMQLSLLYAPASEDTSDAT